MAFGDAPLICVKRSTPTENVNSSVSVQAAWEGLPGNRRRCSGEQSRLDHPLKTVKEYGTQAKETVIHKGYLQNNNDKEIDHDDTSVKGGVVGVRMFV